MKLLFVAMSNSIHTARWIGQAADQGWDLHLFPSLDNGIAHAELRNMTLHHSIYARKGKSGETVRTTGLYLYDGRVAYVARMAVKNLWKDYHIQRLARLIERLRPDVIHSMEFQAGAYLTLEAKARTRKPFPKWIATNWGSDIYLFGRLASHRERIAQILADCDYYSCECLRDVALARGMGFRGQVLPVFPNTGGFDLDELRRLRQAGLTSSRRVIMLKGYQHWAGRALVGIRALERCADLLADYTVVVYSADDDVVLATELLRANKGIRVVVLPKRSPHDVILAHHAKARLSIGLSISDAISTSFLESIAMGSFPIQSNTSCANEWAEHGRTALLVPPEDPEVIEAAIRRALADDELVDRAAELNWQTVQDRLDADKIKPAIVDLYRRIHAGEPVAPQ